MTKETQAAYDKTVTAIADNAMKLAPLDYRDYLEELKAHLRSLIDCWHEENPDE